MNTPIVDFVKGYQEEKISRFHMPGHKGKVFLGCEPLDITEINGADVLYSPNGIIEESENNASALFGSAHSFYSTEGSSLAIKAMLSIVTSQLPKAQKPLILAGRNAHKAFVYACALLDLEVKWLLPSSASHLCSCLISPEELEQALQAMQEAPTAVYLTSPDYLGQMADMEGIANVCHRYKIPLLVDNAHGAYLHFLSPSRHPIDLGADLCCDSAHKTLPVLTGGAYLHISKKADPSYLKAARAHLSIFASTSPSYLILQSLDLCNQYLSSNYKSRLQACIQTTEKIKKSLKTLGFSVEQSEPLKLLLNARTTGYTGNEMATHLRSFGIEIEFSDPEYCILMITPENTDTDFERLVQAFSALPIKAPTPMAKMPIFGPHQAPVSIRQAIFSPSESIPTEQALGRICATPTVSCPPAIPIVMSGERITENDLILLKRYEIDRIDVVKE